MGMDVCINLGFWHTCISHRYKVQRNNSMLEIWFYVSSIDRWSSLPFQGVIYPCDEIYCEIMQRFRLLAPDDSALPPPPRTT
jgi:hypothetical protein